MTANEFCDYMERIGCCYQSKSFSLFSKKELGICTKTLQKEVDELFAYLYVLKCVKPEDDDQCLNDEQLLDIFEKALSLCDNCC